MPENKMGNSSNGIYNNGVSRSIIILLIKFTILAMVAFACMHPLQ